MAMRVLGRAAYGTCLFVAMVKAKPYFFFQTTSLYDKMIAQPQGVTQASVNPPSEPRRLDEGAKLRHAAALRFGARL